MVRRGRHIIDLNDQTPEHRHWEPGQYNPRCSACWLGHQHSQAWHAQATR